MTHRIEQLNQGHILHIALDPDGVWARSEFPDALITVDFGTDDNVIGISAARPAAGRALDAYRTWLLNGGDLIALLGRSAVDVDGFHAQEGFFFKRQRDGSVLITVTDPMQREVQRQVELQPAAWASVVAAVSAEGEDGPRWRAALDFHGNPVPEPSDAR